MHCLCFEGSPWSLTKMHNQHYWILLICEGYLPPPLSPHVLLTHLCAVHWVGGVVAHGSWPQMLTTLKDRSWFDPANGAKHDWHCLTHLDTSWHILTHLDASWQIILYYCHVFACCFPDAFWRRSIPFWWSANWPSFPGSIETLAGLIAVWMARIGFG